MTRSRHEQGNAEVSGSRPVAKSFRAEATTTYAPGASKRGRHESPVRPVVGRRRKVDAPFGGRLPRPDEVGQLAPRREEVVVPRPARRVLEVERVGAEEERREVPVRHLDRPLPGTVARHRGDLEVRRVDARRRSTGTGGRRRNRARLPPPRARAPARGRGRPGRSSARTISASSACPIAHQATPRKAGSRRSRSVRIASRSAASVNDAERRRRRSSRASSSASRSPRAGATPRGRRGSRRS